MKTIDLVFDLLVEDVKNKKLFNFLMNDEKNPNAWRKTYPNLTDEQGVYIFNRHNNLKDQIKPTHPAVSSFLSRHDGNFGTKKYELKELTDITKFNIKELVEFLREFGKFEIDIADEQKDNVDKNEVELRKIFTEKGNNTTPEKIEASKKMWTDVGSALINEDKFRVYEVFNQQQSIRMGYYYQFVHKNLKKVNKYLNSPWCVTWREGVRETVEDENGVAIADPIIQYDNRYRTYRMDGRTFYFVIDEARSVTDRYHMSALQAIKGGGYILTSMANDGDNRMTWEEIINIYPKLSPFKDKINPRAFTDKEITELSFIDTVDENEGSSRAFWRLTPQDKELYIDLRGSLTKSKSWDVMNKELRVKYIDNTNPDDATTRFSTEEFLKAVINTPGFKDRLSRRLQIIGIKEGISHLVKFILRTYRTARVSLDNPFIILYTDPTKTKYGLFNVSTFDWLNFGGITYELKYKQPEISIWIDSSENSYVVETYMTGSEPDNSTFYCVIPTELVDKSANGHFMSHNSFTKLQNQLTPLGDDAYTIDKFDPEMIDIKERKKGV